MISRGSLSSDAATRDAASQPAILGWWHPDEARLERGPEALARALEDPFEARFVLDLPEHGIGLATPRSGRLLPRPDGPEAFPVRGILPACRPQDLGSQAFRDAHGLRYAYVAGAMANGIGSVEIVESMARAGMLGFYGAAGQSIAVVAEAISRLSKSVGTLAWGVNLIHSPFEPDLERAMVDLLIDHGVTRIEASAYMDLTLEVVRYRLHGIRRRHDGSMHLPHRIVAKVSRAEVAEKFLAPAPERLVSALVEAGELTAEQAALARQVPMADDLTVEADSAGHTDNRPAIALLPTLIALRDRLQEQFHFAEPLRVGLGGGISTPTATAAAFALGADYVVTGSVNQACVESGSSDKVRQMLAQAEQADITMAPAADMFEMGVKVQVLKRGTMFPMRAQKLYELYRAYGSLEEIPERERTSLERTIFRAELGEIWGETQEFFRRRDPAQIERASKEAKHRMALVFRWYLGQSSHWANVGREDRVLDYQVWCGPAMGAFNEWARGSFLEEPKERRVDLVARNLLYGASRSFRAQALQAQGLSVPSGLLRLRPLPADKIEEIVP